MDNTFIFNIDLTELKYLSKQKSLNIFCEILVQLVELMSANEGICL